MQGLIIENVSNLYRVEVKRNNQKVVYEATARGKFKKDEIMNIVEKLENVMEEK